MEIGTILRSFIGKNRDGKNDVLLHQVQMLENDDIQTVEQQHIPGFQYNPPVESRGFVSRVTRAWKIALGIFDIVGRISLNPGEIILYSSSGGAVAASIRWNDDGSIDITAPGDVNIIGNTNITGNQTITGSIECDDEIIADLEITAGFASTPIEVTQHPHVGDLNFNTGPPVVVGGGIAPPGTPPVFDQGDNTIDMGNQDIKNVLGISATVGTHDHPVTSAPGTTGQPN